MDALDALRLACLGTGAIFLMLGLVLVGGRAAERRRVRSGPAADAGLARLAAAAGVEGTAGEWERGLALLGLAQARHAYSDRLLRHALRSDDPELRHTAITALGLLADTEDWALDLLLEALAEQSGSPARVATQLDRVAGRAGHRLLPLLTHPAPGVRAAAARLLARCPELAGPSTVAACRDPHPAVRAAALETAGAIAGPGSLRVAMQALTDDQPAVRLRAARAAARLGGVEVAPHLTRLLGDASWQVREVASEALVGLGAAVGPAAVRALSSRDAVVRAGAARVLEESGALASMTPSVYADLLARIADVRDAGPVVAELSDVETGAR